MLLEKPHVGRRLATEIPDDPITNILPVQEDGLKAPPVADIEKQAPINVTQHEGEVQADGSQDPYLVNAPL